MHKLLSEDPTRLGRPDVPPCSDAVDERLVGGTPEELKTDLAEILGEDVRLKPCRTRGKPYLAATAGGSTPAPRDIPST